MDDTLTIDAIKAQHEELFDQALEKAPQLRRTIAAMPKAGERVTTPSNGSQAFLDKVNKLLENLTQLSSQVSSFEDYRWLSHTAVKWQNVFAFLDVPTFIKLNPPAEHLLLPIKSAATSPEMALTEQELDFSLKLRAELFAYHRIGRLNRLSSDSEMESDRHMAFVCLASDILDGKTNFVNRIAVRSYRHLEWVWMEELKHLRAYLLWHERGGAFGVPPPDENYFAVCNHLRKMLTDPGIKMPAAAFEPVHAHLKDKYLTHGKINVVGHPFARLLVGEKALRLFLHTGRTHEEQNWIHAEAYVKTFYENITAAAVDGDYEATLCVLRALQCQPNSLPSQCHIINAFEATLATYFLRPDVVQKIWDDGKLNADAGHSSIISEVEFRGWPAHFNVPPNCTDVFESSARLLRFRGVMSVAQKDALLAQLTGASHQAIQVLFQRSRVVRRDSTL